MSLEIKRLGPGDEAILTLLALENADFDLDDRGEPETPLAPAAARAYLSNPGVLQWVALAGDEVVGELYCLEVPLGAAPGPELLLYSIGVRRAWRRRGVGRALLDHMDAWMRDHDLNDVWVLADNPGAVDFYRASGFAVEQPEPVYLTRSRDADS